MRSNRSAKARVNCGGMCWQTNTHGVGSTASPSSTRCTAGGPPVEAPTATTSGGSPATAMARAPGAACR